MLALLGSDPAAIGATARTLLAAGRDPERFAEIDAAMAEGLSAIRRDALLGWLVAYDAPMTDAGRVYDHLLIDSEMAPCFMTTRTLAAIAATQLFIQRFLFGLEQESIAGDREDWISSFRARWSWMRSYRLWEANRRVYLFPENWLLPELRDDKSAAFRTLESGLARGELTAELADDVFGAFLDEVAVAGRMQVVGMFEDVERDPSAPQTRARRDLYVVGRTPSPPYAYHWRKCRDFGRPIAEWTPWQRVELDIPSDHVIPFVLQGRLHLAWPRLRKVGEPDAQALTTYVADLHVSGLSEVGWREVRVSRTDGLEAVPPNQIQLPPFSDERVGLTLRAMVDPGGRTATVRAYLQGRIAGSTWSTPPRVESAPTSLSVPEQFLNPVLVSEVIGVIQRSWDILPADNKAVFFTFTMFEASHDRVTPATLPGLAAAFRWFGVLEKEYYQDKDWKNFVEARRLSGVFMTEDRYKSQILAIFGDAAAVPARAPNLAVRNELIARCLRALATHYSWGAYGYGGVQSAYRDAIRELLDGLAERSIIVRAWWRTQIGAVQQVESSVEITNAYGPVSISVDSAPDRPVTLNSSIGFTTSVLGDIPEATLRLTWRGLTATQRVPQVPRGKKAVEVVHFEFQGTPSPAPTGLLPNGASFLASLDFKVSLGGRIEVMRSPSAEQLAQAVVDGGVYMNGFVEPERAGVSGGLSNTAGLIFNDTRPLHRAFETSAHGSRYLVIGAAQPGSALSGPVAQSADIWSYREGDGKCLIDRRAEAGALAIYPDGWYDQPGALAAWAVDRTLPPVDRQFDSFGSALTPNSALKTTAMVNGLLGFDSRMPYASYNWEVYLHAPLYVASQFARQQRFQDADRWFRFVFDPTSGEGGPGPARLMRFRPFRDLIGNGGARGEVEALARITASEARGLGPTAQMHEAVARIRHMIARWRDEPYRPFAIARRRHAAFLWRTVYAYVDNLIAWADDLFRRDTRESISEATLLYALAARILGRRPRVSGSATGRTPRTYDELEARLDAFGNAWIAAQGPRPVGPRPPAVEAGNGGPVEYAPPEPGVLYFCLPFNEKLLTLWDTVEDRLFKIRHCRSIDGIARNLPFIDPPIDPGLLVRATAAGLDVESVLAGLHAPPARQRFPLLLSRALELVGEMRGLSAAVLSALEKRDSEALSRLRSDQEVELLNRIRSVRSQQIEEASQAVVALRKSREIAESRFVYLSRLLGLDDITAPGRGERRGEIPLLRMPTSDTGLAPEGLGLIQEEADQYTALQGAYDWSLASSVTKTAAGGVFAFGGLPDPYGKVFTALGHAASATADAFAMASAGWRNYVERVGMFAAQLRRRDEWAHQANQALRELAQIDEQLLATELRLAIVTAERDNHIRQIEHAETVAAYLREKFTSEELHDWMAGELTALAGQTYRMTLMLARQAQQAAVRELGLQANDLSVISAQHGGEGRGVLLAAERLQQELRRLEIAYHDQNRRLHEMTKHVSLRLLDAEAFAMLKLDGMAQFELPEWLFDLDMPGHFGRRIKSVSLSIPCIVGPYASVNCKLTLLRHDVRIVPTTQPAYARLPDDRRFVTSYGPIESIVTSSGRDDSGLFELSLRDDRYLPFEHAGVISRWRVQIPSPQFDLATISDVILHIRYTAREDESLGAALVASAAASPVTGSVLLSLRDDFSAEWASARAGTGTVEITVDTKLLPYALRRGRAVISKVSALRIRRNSDGLIEPASDWERVATAPGPVSLAGLAGLEDCLLAVHVGSGT